jgi:hypothetical protein
MMALAMTFASPACLWIRGPWVQALGWVLWLAACAPADDSPKRPAIPLTYDLAALTPGDATLFRAACADWEAATGLVLCDWGGQERKQWVYWADLDVRGANASILLPSGKMLLNLRVDFGRSCEPELPNQLSRTIGHELGHALLGLGDAAHDAPAGSIMISPGRGCQRPSLADGDAVCARWAPGGVCPVPYPWSAGGAG